MGTLTSLQYAAPSLNVQHRRHQPWQPSKVSLFMINHSGLVPKKRVQSTIKCNSSSGDKGGIGIVDFIGGDLLKLDLGQWLSDVEEHKSIAIYTPHEGGYEGRYLTRLRYQGYHLMEITARGLGDPETTLTKVHPVCPVLSKSELQFLALLPSLRPNVRVIAECGNWRKVMWKPLKEIAGLAPLQDA